ncbi:MAG: hypothetical protein KGN16_01585 [Burkholderiales bacterium]|nr:hypothetical protein [Burkholderiales bacterium]
MFEIRRFQLFEFNDQSWFPSLLRESFNDALAMTHAVYAPYGRAALAIADWMSRTPPESEILDLGSAGGRHIVSVLSAARRQGIAMHRFVLSDLYPAVDAWRLVQAEVGAEHCRYLPEPVSALAVPADAPRYRTLFTAFHHFPPAAARELLADFCRSSGDGLCIAEYLDRGYYNLLMVLLAAPFYLLIPFFAKKNRLLKFLISTLIPIVPVLFVWDGLVSTLRAYKVDEVRAMLPSDAEGCFDVVVRSVWFGLAPLKSRLIFITRKV